ncbi:hypothetical protein EVAR_6307_1 [Eumeta japonica]|uniref:Uncharacterized protein n=1 Tax=Eumeta variegata TaxID=151549 RepID=A0A4C1T8D0_EUMVA|nr:hypothetical protein EVAR_6307_1 [Eumeta japonica]
MLCELKKRTRREFCRRAGTARQTAAPNTRNAKPLAIGCRVKWLTVRHSTAEDPPTNLLFYIEGGFGLKPSTIAQSGSGAAITTPGTDSLTFLSRQNVVNGCWLALRPTRLGDPPSVCHRVRIPVVFEVLFFTLERVFNFDLEFFSINSSNSDFIPGLKNAAPSEAPAREPREGPSSDSASALGGRPALTSAPNMGGGGVSPAAAARRESY